MKQLRQILFYSFLYIQISLSQSMGTALQFDSSYVSISPDTIYNISQTITLEVWVKCSEWQVGAPMFIAKGINEAYFLGYEGAPEIRISSDRNASGTTPLRPNTWYYIAGTYDGTDLKLYVNGTLEATTYAPGVIPTTRSPLLVGAGWNDSTIITNFYGGILDEVRIWNIALTQEQIQINMYKTLLGTEDGLIGYWQFDEGNGSLTEDASTRQNQGSLIDEPSWVPSIVPSGGIAGCMLEFNGSNSVALPGDTLWNFGTKSFSVEAWVQTTTTNQYASILVYDNAFEPGGAWVLRMDNGQILFAIVNYGDRSTASLISSSAFNDGLWHHIAGVRDEYAGQIRLYVDGILATTPVSDQSINVVGENTYPSIGEYGSYIGVMPFNGCIDEVRIWNTARTEDQIQSYSHQLLHGDENGLVGYWRLDEGIGDTTEDLTANNHHGILMNNPRWLLSTAPIELAAVGVESLCTAGTPNQYIVSQNYPNPFNPSTMIRFGIPVRSYVRVEIYNLLGQQIEKLVDGELHAGYFEKTWHANVSTGFYIYRLEATPVGNTNKKYIEVKKMLLLR